MTRPSIVCALGGLLVGCGEAATNPNTADFAGAWRYVETMRDLSAGVSCADTGVYRLSQTGTDFAGDYVQSGVCQTTMGFLDNTDSGGVANGVVVGRTLRFTAAQVCDYDGKLDPNSGGISGHLLCLLADAPAPGDTIRLAGTWTATR